MNKQLRSRPTQAPFPLADGEAPAGALRFENVKGVVFWVRAEEIGRALDPALALWPVDYDSLQAKREVERLSALYGGGTQ